MPPPRACVRPRIWNDFMFANTFVLSEDLKTIPLGAMIHGLESGASKG